MCPTMFPIDVLLDPPAIPPLWPPPPPPPHPLPPLVQLAPPGLRSLISSWTSFFSSSFRAKWSRLVWMDWGKNRDKKWRFYLCQGLGRETISRLLSGLFFVFFFRGSFFSFLCIVSTWVNAPSVVCTRAERQIIRPPVKLLSCFFRIWDSKAREKSEAGCRPTSTLYWNISPWEWNRLHSCPIFQGLVLKKERKCCQFLFHKEINGAILNTQHWNQILELKKFQSLLQILFIYFRQL